ncbi:MAG: S46 family peptidase [Candidatus Zixiibacteriota bacterium]
MFARLTSFRVIIISFGFVAASVLADEGMWPLYDLHKLPWDSLRARGLELTQEQIFDGKGGGVAAAVVDAGSTGSFVSSDGLIITNHHVAFGAIQRHSTVEHNYLRDGFYAPTHDKEIPASGYHARVLIGVEDVTKRVVKGLKATMSDVDRHKAVEKATKQIIKEKEKPGETQCEVAEMFGGRQYVLYTFLDIRDVRIVYVPPDAIGNFGGDIDNWMWPRHVGDFSFLRAYSGPDGRPADFASENIPFHPKVFLPIDGDGVKEGDLTFIIGNPGHTDRYESYSSFKFRLEEYLPKAVQSMQDRIDILHKAGQSDSALALRLEAKISGISNYLKKFQGMLSGYAHTHALARKRSQEDSLLAFLSRDASLQAKYAGTLPGLDSLFEEQRKLWAKDYALGTLKSSGDLFSMAGYLYKLAVEREKPDMERQPGYQNRDTSETRGWLERAQINLVPRVDKETFKYAIKRALELPSDKRISAIDNMFAAKSDSEISASLDSMYANTKVGDRDARMAMFRMTRGELEKLHDPFIDLAIVLKPESDAQLERSKAFDGAEKRLKPLLVEAYEAWRKDALYPDANGTTRINFGEVKGYSPGDAVQYSYATTVKGIMEKETGQDPFVVPSELKQTYYAGEHGPYFDAHIGDVPVNFISTNDGTNGNSGSPLLNGRGELVGLDFDTNYEGVGGDYLYDPSMKRAIAVDMRYMLYIIDRVYHLDGLLKELTVRYHDGKTPQMGSR